MPYAYHTNKLLSSVDIAKKVDSGTFPSLIVFLFEEFNKWFCHS